MSELSPEARRVLALGDDADASPADEARVRKRLEAELGVALPVAALAVSATAHAAAANTVVTGGAALPASAGTVTGAAAGGATVTSVTGAAAASGAVAGGATSSVLTLVVAGVVAVASGAVLTSAVIRAAQPGPVDAPQVPAANGPEAPLTVRVPPVEADSEAVELPPTEAVVPAGAGEPAGPDTFAPESRSSAPESKAEPDVGRPSERAPKPRGRSDVAAGPPESEAVAQGAGAAAVERLPPPPPPAGARLEPALPRPDHCDPRVELKHVEAAEAALRNGEPDAALAQLEGYYRTCPTGEWHPRAWLIRTGSLCIAGRLQEAAALIDWYESEHPADDDLLWRARQWCPDSVLVRHE